jgi:hypothetical protein
MAQGKFRVGITRDNLKGSGQGVLLPSLMPTCVRNPPLSIGRRIRTAGRARQRQCPAAHRPFRSRHACARDPVVFAAGAAFRDTGRSALSAHGVAYHYQGSAAATGLNAAVGRAPGRFRLQGLGVNPDRRRRPTSGGGRRCARRHRGPPGCHRPDLRSAPFPGSMRASAALRRIRGWICRRFP